MGVNTSTSKNRLSQAIAKVFFVIAFTLFIPLSVDAFFWIHRLNKVKKIEYSFSRAQPAKSKELNMVFISDVYLYPIPVSQEKYPDPPKSKIGILYQESQVLFQEMIKHILDRDKKQRIDFVLFGGSQVADNLHWDLFLDVAYDLTKNSVDYKSMVGNGELQGPKRVKDIIKEKYFYKKVNDVHIVALNDVHRPDDVDFVLEQSHDLKSQVEDPQTKGSSDYAEQGLSVMDGFESIIPCKCTTCFEDLGCKQSNWLTELIASLKKNVKENEDVFVFSYKELKPELSKYLQALPNLRLVAHSYNLKFSINETPNKIIHMTNGALSVYPCAYTSIKRNSKGGIKIERILVPLPGVRRKGRDELETMGINYKEYDGSSVK